MSLKKDGSGKTRAVIFHSDSDAFVMKAVGAGGNVSEFIRKATLAAAAKINGQDPPDVPEVSHGRFSPISLAAQEAGMSVKDFMRAKTNEALGIKTETTGSKRATAPKKKAAKRK